MMQPKSSAGLQDIDMELKEAVCDALVNMVTTRASGTDEAGRIIFGRSPRRGIFSGQLLPRLSRQNVDETSDIKIAAIGIDFMISSTAVSQLTATPKFSVYVRTLPTWEEITDPRYGIDIEFKLDNHVKAEIDEKIKTRRSAQFEKENVARPNWKAMDEEQRSAVSKRRREIQDEVRISVYAEHGIKLQKSDLSAFDEERPQQPTDEQSLAAGEGIEDTAVPAAPSIGQFIREGRSIPFALLNPAAIPGKWQRVDLSLPTCTWSPHMPDDASAQWFDQYSRELRASITQQLALWLATEGQMSAWRDQMVRPGDAQSKEAWDRFLAGLREIAPDPVILPTFDALSVRVERQVDFMDPARTSVRVLLDNGCTELSAQEFHMKCNVLFGTELCISISDSDHLPMKLDRVEPSYRFRNFLDYPAIGLNCGIVSSVTDGIRSISTTWSPRFVQPRVVPRNISVEWRFAELAKDQDIAGLLDLPREYLSWVDQQEKDLESRIVLGLTPEDAAREQVRFQSDIAGQRLEARYIEQGIRLLIEAREASIKLKTCAPAQREELSRRAAPWTAWLLTNKSFARRDRRDPERGWRLFQLAFVLAHIPTFASRIPEYADTFDLERDERAASLLYFPTGGGKSEAFYGALLFAIFLDRLRGKNRGVTAMIRYPLRLLTLQQAQRLLKLLVQAELVRRENKVGSWPIEIGFWVGSSNTPNRYSEVRSNLVYLDDHPDDSLLEEGVRLDEKPRLLAMRYREVRASYNKIPVCPCCNGPTGLRRFKTADKSAERMAIICFDTRCDWNESHGALTPLPFLLTDDTIYQRAPAVVLGTVDKLAMLGQHTSTITNILGMFGLGRWVSPDGHIENPRVTDKLRSGPEGFGLAGIHPAYEGGVRVFHDPFPSLIIQDEAHLLEESLGTFSGLFDTLLEKTFVTIDDICGDQLRVSRYIREDGTRVPRQPKMIAATATISDPDRQLKTLYQRKPLRFPYPGPDLYRSFFAEPKDTPPGNAERRALSRAIAPHLAPEATSPWMRLYVSLMTNDATHTVTTVGVLSSFQALIAELWSGLLDDSSVGRTVALIRNAVSSDVAGQWRRNAIDRAVAEGRTADLMALVDLHRISLAYVTNKKGGDQIIDALHTAVAARHQLAGLPMGSFRSRLISGGVDMQQIQNVMGEAEAPFEGAAYPPIDETLRSIVATSAISHGVDVDRFNSMFFAGLPSDIAEYIQASSRVGRTHVGFVMLLPTPQSRRDRYVVETHDIFHRFLERMIAPPAVERWAEHAIKRASASYVQAWAMLHDAQQFQNLPDARKGDIRSYDSTAALRSAANRDYIEFADGLAEFMLCAMGMDLANPSRFGGPPYPEFYRAIATRSADDFGRAMTSSQITSNLQGYWEDYAAAFKKPMTSLRDVDEAGVIRASLIDPGGSENSRFVRLEDVTKVMKAIRGQKGDAAETDGEGDD